MNTIKESKATTISIIQFTLDALFWSLTLFFVYIFFSNLMTSWLIEKYTSYYLWKNNIFAQFLSVIFTLSRESLLVVGLALLILTRLLHQKNIIRTSRDIILWPMIIFFSYSCFNIWIMRPIGIKLLKRSYQIQHKPLDASNIVPFNFFIGGRNIIQKKTPPHTEFNKLGHKSSLVAHLRKEDTHDTISFQDLENHKNKNIQPQTHHSILKLDNKAEGAITHAYFGFDQHHKQENHSDHSIDMMNHELIHNETHENMKKEIQHPDQFIAHNIDLPFLHHFSSLPKIAKKYEEQGYLAADFWAEYYKSIITPLECILLTLILMCLFYFIQSSFMIYNILFMSSFYLSEKILFLMISLDMVPIYFWISPILFLLLCLCLLFLWKKRRDEKNI